MKGRDAVWHDEFEVAMKAMEFETTMNEDGHIVLPPELAGDIPEGQPVKVVVLWETDAVDPAWRAAGRPAFENAYCEADSIYEQLLDEA